MKSLYSVVWRTASMWCVPMAVLGQNQSDGGDIVALGATQARVAGNDAGGSGAAGIAIVDIADANAAGVSHNRYAAFHVGPAGVVLNNTVGTGPAALSQLAGQVGPNRGMTRAAALILNEVVSPAAAGWLDSSRCWVAPPMWWSPILPALHATAAALSIPGGRR